MWSNVLNSALPPQRHMPGARPEHHVPVIHMAQNKREKKGKKERKKEREREKERNRERERGREGGRKEGREEKVIKIKNLLKIFLKI